MIALFKKKKKKALIMKLRMLPRQCFPSWHIKESHSTFLFNCILLHKKDKVCLKHLYTPPINFLLKNPPKKKQNKKPLLILTPRDECSKENHLYK